jgi:light-regulated signal transduction histidine kinase (bacteriophytochrome)
VNVTEDCVPKESIERLQQGLQKALGHDLPNHLLAIQGMLQLVEREQGEKLGAEGRAYLKRLTAATARTQAFVRALHLFAQAGRVNESWEDVPLIEAARGAATEVRALFPERGIEFGFDLRATTARVPGRSFRLVLVQLLAQAVQNLAQGRSELEIGSAPAGAAVLVWVSEKFDSDGADIPARVAEAEGPESAKIDHLLSLVMVREIVAAWNAQLRVDLGQGRPLLALVLPARGGG